MIEFVQKYPIIILPIGMLIWIIYLVADIFVSNDEVSDDKFDKFGNFK